MLLTTLVTMMATGAFTPVVTNELRAPNGMPTLELGELSEPLSGELSNAVQAWAVAHRQRYQLAAPSTLTFSHAFATRFGASFHLLQTVEGVEVYGAKLVVTLDPQARVVQVASSLASFDVMQNHWRLDEAQALRKAAAGVVLPALRPDGSGLPYGGAKKMLFAVDGQLHAGYLTHVSSLDFSKNWYVAVDAVTGERIFVQNRVHHAGLEANVYPISPGGLDAGVGVVPTTVAQLTHADGGTMVAAQCEQLQPDGGWETFANTNSELCGFQMTQFNCCAQDGCRADAGTKRTDGRTQIDLGQAQLDLKYSIAVCDRLRRASPSTSDAGTYQYPPVDPPANPNVVDIADPSNSDPFAEVHSFYHVNRVYDWVRGLSAAGQVIFAGQPAVRTFAMRDERRTPARKPAIWANVMFPNFNELQSNITGLPSCLTSPPCSTHADSLIRVDNAAFFPQENFAQLPLPGFDTGVDTLLIFQGNAADAAYDATVIQHEFGHGVVYATAELTFDNLAIDNRSANNEGGALHEGFADYIAGAFNDVSIIGPYFGPRVIASAGGSVVGVSQDGYLRRLDNDLACPDVLWGEVHQDSQHVSGALWAGRAALRGTDNAATYDAAFYAMLVSIAPNADFAAVAAAMTARVKQAFPAQAATAETTMNTIFKTKGVIECSKIVDVTGAAKPRAVYQVNPWAASTSALVPGPYQFKLRTPNGATRVHVTAQVASAGGGLGGGGAPRVTLLAKEGAPITFTKTGSGLNNDSTHAVQLSGQATLTGNLDVNAPCGANSEVYLTLAKSGQAAATLINVAVTFDAPASCAPPDAGTTETDGGTTTTTTIPAVGENNTTSAKPAKVCGCSSAELLPMASLALLALGLRRRLVKP